MESKDFEQAFGDFIDRREYDQAQSCLFSMVRQAFLAGWSAAGGKPPQPQPVFQLLHRQEADSPPPQAGGSTFPNKKPGV